MKYSIVFIICPLLFQSVHSTEGERFERNPLGKIASRSASSFLQTKEDSINKEDQQTSKDGNESRGNKNDSPRKLSKSFLQSEDGNGNDSISSRTERKRPKKEKSQHSRSSSKSPPFFRKSNVLEGSEENQQRSKDSSENDNISSETEETKYKGKSYQRSRSSSRSPIFLRHSMTMQFNDGGLKPILSESFDVKTADLSKKYSDLFSRIMKIKEFSSSFEFLIYSYPIFTNESNIFSLLEDVKQFFPLRVTAFLTELSLNAFPNGIENLLKVKEELESLQEGLPYMPMLTVSFLSQISMDIPEKINPDEKVNFLVDVEGSKISEFILKFEKAHRDRDARLLRGISISDIRSFLKNQSCSPKSIQEASEYFNETVDWISWNILRQKTTDFRNKLIRAFCFLGHNYIEECNFHGVMQIASVLSKSCISRLIPDTLHDENYSKIMDFVKPNDNFKNYKDALLESYKKHKSHILPILPVIMADIVHSYEVYRTSLDFFSMKQGLVELSSSIKDLSMCRVIPCSNPIPPEFYFVWEFEKINEDILDVMSSLRFEWPILVSKKISPQELAKWDVTHLYNVLKKCNDLYLLEELLVKGITNGDQLSSYILSSTTKSKEEMLIDMGFNDSARSTILSTYL